MAEDVETDSALTGCPPEMAANGEESASPKRTAIVAAATELFTQSGYGAVSMDAIAAKAGVSKRTVYSHFPGKDVLFAAVMTRHCGRLSGESVWELDPEVEPREMLTDRGMRFLRLITSPEAVSLFRTVTAEAERFPELGRTFFETGPKCWFGSFEDYLRAQDKMGRLRVPNPEVAAKFLFALLKDPLHLRMMLGVQAKVTEAEIAAHVKTVVEVFLEQYRRD
ncbi:TetR/AcrR family transcriptional regulator [Pelagibius sp. CAU 1746]|uniref:TetR/AcrR family transcriptional regulator n=1 Tax=Pelagibius sp. CAU 1746 TaxID=3140370 RepID=UPI00325BDDD9